MPAVWCGVRRGVQAVWLSGHSWDTFLCIYGSALSVVAVFRPCAWCDRFEVAEVQDAVMAAALAGGLAMGLTRWRLWRVKGTVQTATRIVSLLVPWYLASDDLIRADYFALPGWTLLAGYGVCVSLALLGFGGRGTRFALIVFGIMCLGTLLAFDWPRGGPYTGPDLGFYRGPCVAAGALLLWAAGKALRHRGRRTTSVSGLLPSSERSSS
jgi:hypothetical protein